jgi:hypothetical protein
MFGRIRLTYWDTLRGRAWILTRDLFGWDVKTGVVAAICFVAGLGLHAWNRGSEEVLDNLTITLIYAFPFAIGGLAVFVVNVLRAARMMYSEQQEEIKRHEEALAAYSRRADLASRLVALRREGVAIRNRRLQKSAHPSIDGLTLAGWTPEVEAWEERVLDTIRGHVSAQDYGRFQTLDTYTEKMFGWQINSLHGKYLSMLSRRIEILLEIMGQF